MEKVIRFTSYFILFGSLSFIICFILGLFAHFAIPSYGMNYVMWVAIGNGVANGIFYSIDRIKNE